MPESLGQESPCVYAGEDVNSQVASTPKYLHEFESKEDGLATFVFYNNAGSLCAGFKDTDSGNMVSIRQNLASIDVAVAYAKSLLGI